MVGAQWSQLFIYCNVRALRCITDGRGSDNIHKQNAEMHHGAGEQNEHKQCHLLRSSQLEFTTLRRNYISRSCKERPRAQTNKAANKCRRSFRLGSANKIWTRPHTPVCRSSWPRWREIWVNTWGNQALAPEIHRECFWTAELQSAISRGNSGEGRT